MSYIEKEPLLEKAKSLQGNLFGAVAIVREIEKADVVEVVRCEKCKYGEVAVFSRTIDGEERKACYCNLENKVTSVDWYCPSGERRDT